MVSKAYIVDETTIQFRASGGNVVFDLAPSSVGLATLSGRQSAHHTLGTTARAFKYKWRAFAKMQTTPVVNEEIRVYLKTSDGTNPDNDDGTGDLAVSSENKLKNIQYLGSIIIDEASTSPVFVASGVVEIYAKDIAGIFWNATADSLSNTTNVSGLDLTPVPFQGQ